MAAMWADRDVTRVVAARFISRVGGEAAFFVGIWGKAAFELEATATGLAAVMAALGVAALIGSAIAGVLVDRFDPRRVLIGGELLFIPVALGMTFADTIPAMVVTTFLLGLVGTPVYTAIASFGPFLTDDPDRLAKVNGYIEGASWAAFVVGPAIGSIITITVGLDGIFVLDAAHIGHRGVDRGAGHGASGGQAGTSGFPRIPGASRRLSLLIPTAVVSASI